MKQRGLGRGLSALLPEAESKESYGALSNVAIKDIHPNPHQPRREFKSEEIAELSASIREKGVIQPIIVRLNPTDSKGKVSYQLIAGERRLRAAHEAGLTEIPVRLLEVENDQEMLELAMIENLQREDLNPIELAKGYERLANEYSLTQEQIAVRVGKNRATVANTLRILELPENVLSAIRSGEISMGHSKAILMLQGAARQSALFKKVVAGRWSVRQTEEAARAMLQTSDGVAKEPSPTPKEQYLTQTDRLRKRLGTQVKIARKGRRGTIKIEFYSDEDLERLIELLGVK